MRKASEGVLTSRLRFVAAPPGLRRTGLIGWVSVVLSGLVELDGIALRRSSTGSLFLSYPRRRDREGRDHAVVRPVDDQARRRIEAEILAALGPVGEAGS